MTTSNRGRWDPLVRDLAKHDIYVNLQNKVNLNFPDVFIKYANGNHDTDSAEWKRWADPNTYFKIWQSQMSFAIHCATTALGVSADLLNDRQMPMINAIYRFHVYYHVRRVLFRLQVKLPYEDGFEQFNNSYSKGAFMTLCSEYGANPNALYKFESMGAAWYSQNPYFWVQENGDYAKWIVPTSPGLTSKGLVKLSESIRLYARLILGSQFQVRASILGSNASSFSVQQNYLQELQSVITRLENIQDDINKFQNLLQYARTPVNFVVTPKCYMIPSDMNLHIGVHSNYNNKILIAPSDSKNGVNEFNKSVRSPDPFQGKRQSPVTVKHLPESEKQEAREYEEEKQAIIIGGGVCLLAFAVYRYI